MCSRTISPMMFRHSATRIRTLLRSSSPYLSYIKIRPGCQTGLLYVKILSYTYRLIFVARPSTSGENVTLMLFYLLKGRADQLATQKLRHQWPDQIGQVGLVAV